MQDITQRTDLLTGSAIPASTVTTLINRQLGTPAIVPRFRVCDITRNRLPVMGSKPSTYDANNLLPWDPSDIGPLCSNDSCTYANDVSKVSPRSLQFVMAHPRYDPTYKNVPFPYDPLNNLIEFSIVFKLGSLSLEVKQGFFKCMMPDVDISPGVSIYHWVLSDLLSLTARPLISDWTVDTQYSGGYNQAMTDMLTSSGTPLSTGGSGQTPQGNDDCGPSIPKNLISINPTGNQAVPFPILFKAGSIRIANINQLADYQNFYPLWVDENARLTTSQSVLYGNGPFPVGWDYSTLPASSIVDVPINRTFGQDADGRVCNVAKIVCSQTTSASVGGGQDFSATVTNRNPNSVVSLVNLKGLDGNPRGLPYFENKSNLPNQAMVDLYAKRCLQLGAMLPETVTFTTATNPFHQNRDLLMLQVTDKMQNVLIPSSPISLFEEQSWSITFGANGGMQHVAMRTIAI